MTTPRHATILLAHGSRDPAWRAPLDQVAWHMRQLQPEHPVRCAFLEWTQPDLMTAVDELLALGVQAITVMPMFLGLGKHAREDLPRLAAQLQTRHPHIRFVVKPSVGEQVEVLQLLARLALS